MSDKQLLNS